MVRFQRFIPVLVFVVIVLLGGTATFISEIRTDRAATAAAMQYNLSPAEADSSAGTASLLVDMPGLPY
jgi:hypothetical protein